VRAKLQKEHAFGHGENSAKTAQNDDIGNGLKFRKFKRVL
jgi:hypothetical protein